MLDALNVEASTFDRLPGEKPGTWVRGFLRKHVFHEHRLPEAGLFRIPETLSAEVFAVTSDIDRPEDDFYQWYKKQNYTGLQFAPMTS